MAAIIVSLFDATGRSSTRLFQTLELGKIGHADSGGMGAGAAVGPGAAVGLVVAVGLGATVGPAVGRAVGIVVGPGMADVVGSTGVGIALDDPALDATGVAAATPPALGNGSASVPST